MENLLIFIFLGILYFMYSKIITRFNNLEDSIDRLINKIELSKTLNTTSQLDQIVTPVRDEIDDLLASTDNLDNNVQEQKNVTDTNTLEVFDKQLLEVNFEKIPTADTVDQIVQSSNDAYSETHQSDYQNNLHVEEEKSFWENFKEKNPDLEKFVGENLINKIGILVLVLGISYFVKYAIDKNWINEIGRVAIGILSGALVMVVAHKLHKKICGI